MVTWSLHRGRHPVPSEAEKLIIFATVSTGEGVGLHQSVDSRMSRTDNQPTNQRKYAVCGCNSFCTGSGSGVVCLCLSFFLSYSGIENKQAFFPSLVKKIKICMQWGAQRKAQFSKVSWTTSWLNRC